MGQNYPSSFTVYGCVSSAWEAKIPVVSTIQPGQYHTERPGLLWFLFRVEHSKTPPACKNGSVPLHSRGYANRDHVHILHAIRAATTRNQTGPQQKSAQRNPLPHFRV